MHCRLTGLAGLAATGMEHASGGNLANHPICAGSKHPLVCFLYTCTREQANNCSALPGRPSCMLPQNLLLKPSKQPPANSPAAHHQTLQTLLLTAAPIATAGTRLSEPQPRLHSKGPPAQQTEGRTCMRATQPDHPLLLLLLHIATELTIHQNARRWSNAPSCAGIAMSSRKARTSGPSWRSCRPAWAIHAARPALASTWHTGP